MRSIAGLAIAVGLAAGCGGAPASPIVSPSPPPSAVPSPTATSASQPSRGSATPSARPSLTAVTARVTFDGTSCTYTGPTVVPYPASLSIEFAPTGESFWIGVTAVYPETTEADLTDPTNPDAGSGVPWFVYLDTHMFAQGSGTFAYRAVDDGRNPMAELGPGGKPYQKFDVLCLKDMPGSPVGDQTMLRLVSSSE